MNQSKFTNWASGKGFRIPAAALELAKIVEGEKLDFHVAEDVIVTLKHRMTAMEMIDSIHALNELSTKLVRELAEVCGTCDECDADDEYVCPSGLTKADYVDLTPEVREAVGIPTDAKLQMTFDPDHAAVTISEAEYEADLSDVPEAILDLLESMDVRLCVLERHLMEGDVIHG